MSGPSVDTFDEWHLVSLAPWGKVGDTLAILSAGGSNHDSARALTGGDPERGRMVAEAYACGTCHTIPGIGTATSKIGPMLGGFAQTVVFLGFNNARQTTKTDRLRHAGICAKCEVCAKCVY